MGRNTGGKINRQEVWLETKKNMKYVTKPDRRVLEMKEWSIIPNAIKTKRNIEEDY